MELKKLGRSDVRLPAIGFGTWNFTGGVEPLRTAINHGASLIDTAEIYGTEKVVGEAIRCSRHLVFLATKVAPRNFRRRDVWAAAERSLRQLGTDYIDLYQLHWPNDTVPIGETMAAMEELVDSGKVRFIGVSNFSVRELEKARHALTRHKIVSNQVRYNLIDRTIELGLLQYCQKHEITVIAYSPLGSGLRQIKDCDPENVLDRIAASSGQSEAQVALNWLIRQDHVIAIPKADRVAHAIENCTASGWRLSQEDYGLLSSKIRCRRRGTLPSALRRRVRQVYQLFGRRL